MRSTSDKDNRSTVHQSLSPPANLSGSSLWNSSEQIKNSPPKSTGSCYESKRQFQEQDSLSMLSTCQTHCAAEENTRRNNSTPQNPGSLNGINGTSAIQAEHQKGSSYLQSANADYMFGQVKFHYNHQMAYIPSYQWHESWVGAFVAAYGPNALVYPQMLGINQTRVPIPLDCAESIPVYVNAKQFRAILRQRQMRAKLEAQRKIFRTRKPYLHESRHRHALNRQRGPGGRFLNKKDANNNKSNAPLISKQQCQQDIDVEASGNNVQHYSNSGSGSWEETSTPSSSSDVTSIFNSKDIFHIDPQQQKQQHVEDDLTCLETGNRLFVSI